LGGEVGDNPNGLEVGTVAVYLNGAAHDDRLLAGFPSPIRVHAWHTQSVTRLPTAARRLAWSDMDAHHVYVVGDRVWGVQFHPEFDADIMIEFMHHDGQDLQKHGIDPQLLIQDCVDTLYGPAVLRRFAEIVQASDST
jgi:GMP synthase (glutamine-hydrolysing)